jgi:microcystin degradation protein MlrC
VTTAVGASLDGRWARPVPVEGRVVRVGADPVVLEGQSMTGQQVSMGRWAVLDTGGGLIVLVTERPAPGFDPAAYRTAGLDPAEADAVVVRSATMYRAGYRGRYAEALVLDLPGASTPRLDYLDFRRAPRPLYPLDVS